MDAEMEETAGEAFVSVDVDLDYEFDAVNFFDFGRDESPEEAALAERWFEAAGSYPPSPFVVKIFADTDVRIERVNNTEESKEDALSKVSAIADGKGWALQKFMQQDVKNTEQRSNIKNHLSKGSTLMKPTASHLAKQNQSCQMRVASRIQKHQEVKDGRSFDSSNEFLHQAIKRQKLELGHDSKVLRLNQQVNLFHKATEKKNLLSNLNSQFPTMKATIPREPELLTARRAVRVRARQARQGNDNKSSEGTAMKSTFKALPLNRKILEAPTLPLPQRSKPQMPRFKEFNFKTHERALKHTSLSSSSSLIGSSHEDPVKGDTKIYQTSKLHNSCQHSQNDAKPAEAVKEAGQKFKAQPLNRKEFGLTTSRCQPAPLTELFNKLALTSEVQMTIPDPATDQKFQRHSQFNSKDTKENMLNLRQ